MAAFITEVVIDGAKNPARQKRNGYLFQNGMKSSPRDAGHQASMVCEKRRQSQAHKLAACDARLPCVISLGTAMDLYIIIKPASIKCRNESRLFYRLYDNRSNYGGQNIGELEEYSRCLMSTALIRRASIRCAFGNGRNLSSSVGDIRDKMSRHAAFTSIENSSPRMCAQS